MRASEFVSEGSGYKLDQDIIDLVKISWDEGKKPKAIAADLGLSSTQVGNILKKYYPSRPGRMLALASGLTDQDKNSIVSRFLNNDTIQNMSKEYSVSTDTVTGILKNKLGDRYYTEINKRKNTPGNQLSNKITPEMLSKMGELYAAGKQIVDIAHYFDNVVTAQSIPVAIRRLPDYEELRAKREENTRKVKHSPVVTTRKTPAGIDGNQRSKGPQSRHTSGVNWPKYG